MALYLILQVQGGPPLEVGDPHRKVFDVAGGRIGRSLDCDWVLSNSYVSRHHATISHANGVFYIESVGANGVVVNTPQAAALKHTRLALHSGDRIFLDKYEISVAIADDPVRPASVSHNDRLDASAAITVPQDWELKEPPEPVVPAAPELDLPLVRVVAPVIKALPGRGSATADFDIEAFLGAAGLTAANIPAGKAGLLGRLVRRVVQGLIEVLQARAEFRSQLHLAGSHAQAAPLNPLRLAGEARDPLVALLQPAAPGALPPLAAVEDALDELRFHQLAMLAGMHAGFQSVTACFDPQKLIEHCDRGPAGGLGRFGAKARYWDHHVSLFGQVATYPDGGLRRQYVEAFSEAYERQLEDLKRSRVHAVQQE